MPWVAIHKPARREPGRLMRWREAHRDRFLVWCAGGGAIALMLGVWFVAARAVAG